MIRLLTVQCEQIYFFILERKKQTKPKRQPMHTLQYVASVYVFLYQTLQKGFEYF